jgi:hypothetical protein
MLTGGFLFFFFVFFGVWKVGLGVVDIFFLCFFLGFFLGWLSYSSKHLDTYYVYLVMLFASASAAVVPFLSLSLSLFSLPSLSKYSYPQAIYSSPGFHYLTIFTPQYTF